MPYRNIVTSNVWSRMLARRRQIVDPQLSTDSQTTESIWVPQDVRSRKGKANGQGDLPNHTWRPNSGVSSR